MTSEAADAIRNFTAAVLHGDDDHRAWLTAAAEAFIAGAPLPEPNGRGRAEAAEAKLLVCRAALSKIRDMRTDLPSRGDYERGFNDARFRCRALADAALSEEGR